jgi:hypothetical protein
LITRRVRMRRKAATLVAPRSSRPALCVYSYSAPPTTDPRLARKCREAIPHR